MDKPTPPPTTTTTTIITKSVYCYINHHEPENRIKEYENQMEKENIRETKREHKNITIYINMAMNQTIHFSSFRNITTNTEKKTSNSSTTNLFVL